MAKAKKTAKKKNNGGRPTKYKDEFCEQAYKLCLLRAIDSEIADFFGVRESTLNLWKKAHPQFMESLQKGRQVADANVAKRLYERATGYEHVETKVFCHDGEIITYDVIKHYPPDTAAAFIWLKNRQKDRWKDRSNLQLTGEDDGPLQINMTVITKNGDS